MQLSQTEQDYILHPVLDTLMIGGLSILFFALMYVMTEGNDTSGKLSWTMYYLSYLVNHPHFMQSYQLLYQDYRHKIFKDIRYTWAAVISPVLLIGLMVFIAYRAYSTNNSGGLGYLPNLLFFLVGHHYVKQVYGCVVVSSVYKKVFYTKLESRVLWFFMYSTWFLSFVSSNSYTANAYDFYGVKYYTFGLPEYVLTTVYWLLGLSGVTFTFFMARKYIKTGAVIPFNAIIAIASILVWYMPKFYSPNFNLMIPFFHSLQYMLFTTAFAKNKSKSLSKKHESPEKQRSAFFVRFSSFIVVSLVTGYLAWVWIPETLDSKIALPTVLGPTMFMFMAQIFLNIHHYFIDNVIWRKDNQQMREFLSPNSI